MIPAFFKLVISLFLIFVVVGFFFTKNDKYCVIDKETQTIRFHMGDYVLDVPRKYVGVCKNREGQLAIMDLTWPEFERKPKFNKNNREGLIKKRLMIGLLENSFSSIKNAPSWHEKVFQGLVTKKNIDNGRLIYSETTKKLANGMMEYVPVNPNSNNIHTDIYVLRDKEGEIAILLKCSKRAVGGKFCKNDFHTAFDTLKVSYSFDVSHLKDAVEIDKKVKEFIEGMVVTSP